MKPIKRDQSLRPLSREHHQGLLLTWKIKKGLAKGVEMDRIKTYCNWFYENHIKPHFAIEEKYVFPVLGNDHELIQKALADHSRLRKLFEQQADLQTTIKSLGEELEQHIRFEERVLFNEIQNIVDGQQLETIMRYHEEEPFVENTSDEFWKD